MHRVRGPVAPVRRWRARDDRHGCRGRPPRAVRGVSGPHGAGAAVPPAPAAAAARVGRSARVAAIRPWLLGTAAAAAVLLVMSLLPGLRPGQALITDLVSKHITYAQIEQPAEFASQDARAVEAWFRQRAGLRVTVSDYSPSGIRLVGGRLAEADDRKAAYVLYEKGHTLMSVFMVPASARGADLGGTRVAYRGHDYLTLERKGYNT